MGQRARSHENLENCFQALSQKAISWQRASARYSSTLVIKLVVTGHRIEILQSEKIFFLLVLKATKGKTKKPHRKLSIHMKLPDDFCPVEHHDIPVIDPDTQEENGIGRDIRYTYSSKSFQIKNFDAFADTGFVNFSLHIYSF